MEDFLSICGGVLLGDDMGLGKTLQALWLIKRAKVGPMLPALIICPASVKYNWEHTALEHVNLRSQVLEGRTPTAEGFSRHLPDLTIINPDILPDWIDFLLKAKFKTVVMDECHKYGNPNTNCTRAAMRLAEEIPYRIALSGTPITSSPSELWPTLYMLRPDKFRSMFKFTEEFCRPRRRFGRMTYKGAKNIDKLHTLLRRTCMVRRLKEDVIKDLPKKMRVVVPMDLTDRDEYNHAVTDFRGWLEANYRDDRGRVVTAMKAAAVSKVGYLVRLAGRLKARAVVEWANTFLENNPDEKLVLFAVHKAMLDVLHRRINAKSVIIDGGVSGKKRKNAVDQFKKDPKTRLFLGNIMAAGVGVDGLQEVCKTVGFAELWWVPGIHAQAEDRIYRIGQEYVAWINYLVAGGTIEEHLCRILQTKQAIIHGTLDGADYEVDMDIFDQLIKVMEDGA